MNLKDYVSQKRGMQAQLARDISATDTEVHDWANKKRPVPAERCPAIERATNGAVRCEDLRPDVDWGCLRGTKRKVA